MIGLKRSFHTPLLFENHYTSKKLSILYYYYFETPLALQGLVHIFIKSLRGQNDRMGL